MWIYFLTNVKKMIDDFDSFLSDTFLYYWCFKCVFCYLGMGELHLEVIKERIRSEYKIDVDMGPMQIAYREMPLAPVTDTFSVNHTIGK